MTTTPLAPRPFHTPVRGFVFSHRPPAGASLEDSPLSLRAEPGNPADPHAVAVWADGGGRPWRVGYLERAVAARLAGRLGEGELDVRFAGWWDEPEGRWHRPVVRIAAAEDAVDASPPLRRRPPRSTTVVRAA